MSTQSPTANGPGQGPEEPFGDRSDRDKPQSPEQGEQGRGDEAPDTGNEDFEEDETNPSPA